MRSSANRIERKLNELEGVSATVHYATQKVTRQAPAERGPRRGSRPRRRYHRHRGACADACERCAQDCERLAGDDAVMREYAENVPALRRLLPRDGRLVMLRCGHELARES